jgi:hypothetical protein
MVSGAMESYAHILRVMHVQYVDNNMIGDLFLAISLGVESSRFIELGFQ